MPSTTGPAPAPSAIPEPNTTTRPCDGSGTATAAPCAASLTASSHGSSPCSVTKPSTTQPGLSPQTTSPHDSQYPFTNGGESEVTEGGASRRGSVAVARDQAGGRRPHPAEPPAGALHRAQIPRNRGATLERRGVGDAGELVGGVEVVLDGARRRVGHGDGVLDVGERAVKDPEPVVEGA